MSSPDNLETRIVRLEREVVRLRERLAESSGDAAAARVLASGADRDVSEVRAELRAHTQALNALRETQREMGQTLADHGVRIGLLDTKISSLESTINSLEARTQAGFAEMRSGMAQIVTLLGGPPPTA